MFKDKYLVLLVSITMLSVFIVLLIMNNYFSSIVKDNIETVTVFIEKEKSTYKNELEFIIINEVKSCLLNNIKHSNPYDEEKLKLKKELLFNDCLNYQMNYNLKHDASRYDFLAKILVNNNIDFNLSIEYPDFNYLRVNKPL